MKIDLKVLGFEEMGLSGLMMGFGGFNKSGLRRVRLIKESFFLEEMGLSSGLISPFLLG